MLLSQFVTQSCVLDGENLDSRQLNEVYDPICRLVIGKASYSHACKYKLCMSLLHTVVTFFLAGWFCEGYKTLFGGYGLQENRMLSP